MPDSNLNSSISSLVTKITNEISSANVDELLQFARAAEQIGESENADIETAINTRINQLINSATAGEIQKLSTAIKKMRTTPQSDIITAGIGDISELTDNQGLLVHVSDISELTDNQGLLVHVSDISELTDTTGLLGSGGATVYANFTAFPSTENTDGDLGFAQDTGELYVWNTNTWNIVSSSSAAPTITSISPNSFDGSSGTVITIQGTNFDVGTVVSFIDSNGVESNASATSIVTQGELTATIPQSYTEAEGPLDVKVTVGSGQNVTTTDAIQTGGSPIWVTSAGQLGGSLYKDSTGVSLQIEATDPDGQFVSYEIDSGLLAPGLSLAAGTGLITGDITTASITADTNYSFTAKANDTTGNSTPRTFFINVLNAGQQIYYTYKVNWGGASSGGWWGHDYGRSPTGSYISGDAYRSDMTIPWGGTTDPHSVWGSGSAVSVASLYDSNWGTSGSFDIGVYIHSGSYTGRPAGTNYMDIITFAQRDVSGGVHRLQSGDAAKLVDPNENFNALQGDTIYVTVRLI